MGEYLFIGSAIFCTVNGLVLLCVNPSRMVNRVLFAGSVWIGIWLFCVAMAIHRGAQYTSGPDQVLIFWLRLSSFVAAFFVWLIALIRIVLVHDTETIQRALNRSRPWLLLSLALAVLPFSEHFILSNSTPTEKFRGFGYAAYTTAISVCCLWQLYDSVKQSRSLSGIRKLEIQAFVLSWIGAGFLVVLCNTLGLHFHIDWLRRSGAVCFTAFHGLAIWAVCYHRVFDAKHTIFSFGQRLALLGLLSALAVLITNSLNPVLETHWSILAAAFITCSIGVMCDLPLRRWLNLDVEHRALAPRRQLVEWAREGLDEPKLIHNFEALLREWNRAETAKLLPLHEIVSNKPSTKPGLSSAGLGLVCKEGWLTRESLERKRPESASTECRAFLAQHGFGALLAVPKGSTSPSLLVALGERQSLRPYTYPDIQVLLVLAELMDNILTHSRVVAHVARIEKMESAVLMSRGLAHDLNSLATPVATFLQHMEQRVTPGTTEATVLADAEASLKIMQAYIKESLFFSRKLSPHFVPIPSQSLLLEAVRPMLERATSEGIRIEVRSSTPFTLSGDRALLQRLLQNLISNAIDASNRGGSVEVALTATEDHRITFLVLDEGAGIPTDAQDRIFEPYFTTKGSGSRRRGIGLGLAICQRIAELHGGHITASRNTPRGTIFTATLLKENSASTTDAWDDVRTALERPSLAEPAPVLPHPTLNSATT